VNAVSFSAEIAEAVIKQMVTEPDCEPTSNLFLPVEEEQGPFAGEPSGQMQLRQERRGRSFAMLSGNNDEAILHKVAELKTASRHHIASLLGLTRASSTRTMRRLHTLGFLDKLTTGVAPPLYTLGVEGRRVLGVPQEEWDVLRCLRLAAANSFWVKFQRIRPEAKWLLEPHLGLTASLTIGKTDLGILVPRLWPGDLDWCKKLAVLIPDNARLIVLAATRSHAEEIARVISVACPVRYTWDRAELRFYCATYGALEEAEDLIC
jgi:hypothetical protein